MGITTNQLQTAEWGGADVADATEQLHYGMPRADTLPDAPLGDAPAPMQTRVVVEQTTVEVEPIDSDDARPDAEPEEARRPELRFINIEGLPRLKILGALATHAAAQKMQRENAEIATAIHTEQMSYSALLRQAVTRYGISPGAARRAWDRARLFTRGVVETVGEAPEDELPRLGIVFTGALRHIEVHEFDDRWGSGSAEAVVERLRKIELEEAGHTQHEASSANLDDREAASETLAETALEATVTAKPIPNRYKPRTGNYSLTGMRRLGIEPVMIAHHMYQTLFNLLNDEQIDPESALIDGVTELGDEPMEADVIRTAVTRTQPTLHLEDLQDIGGIRLGGLNLAGSKRVNLRPLLDLYGPEAVRAIANDLDALFLEAAAQKAANEVPVEFAHVPEASSPLADEAEPRPPSRPRRLRDYAPGGSLSGSSLRDAGIEDLTDDTLIEEGAGYGDERDTAPDAIEHAESLAAEQQVAEQLPPYPQGLWDVSVRQHIRTLMDEGHIERSSGSWIVNYTLLGTAYTLRNIGRTLAFPFRRRWN